MFVITPLDESRDLKARTSVLVGYQLPAKYIQKQIRALAICLVPVMTLMWLATSACVLATIPHLSLLSTLVVAACVTSTDPILSQAIAKGPFADRYVARPLREIISAEAGANDGFGSPFVMLPVNLMVASQHARDVGSAVTEWVTGTLLYIVVMAVAYGAFVGLCARVAARWTLVRRWIDAEGYLLFPTALGVSFSRAVSLPISLSSILISKAVGIPWNPGTDTRSFSSSVHVACWVPATCLPASWRAVC